MPALVLRYLFRAVLANGQVVRQTPKDVCPTDPKRTAFWDLCWKDNNGNGVPSDTGLLMCRLDIVTFELKAVNGQTPSKYLVDLRDGHFEFDNTRIDAVDDKPLLKPFALPLMLVYFRRRREHMNAVSGAVIGSECEYHFGWKDPKRGSQTLILT